MKTKIWMGEYLSETIALDTETEVIPFTETPRIVTFQAYSGNNVCYFVDRGDIASFFDVHNDSNFVLHNASFDIDVIEKAVETPIFYDIIDEGRCFDTMILYTLLHLAEEGYSPFKKSLKFLTEKYLGIELSKEADIRENFGQFLGKPLSAIPEEFLEYAALDAKYTFDLFQILYKKCKEIGGDNLLTHNIQMKGSLALNRIYKNGIRFSQKKKGTFLRKCERELKQYESIINKWGYFRGVKGTQERYEHICWLHQELYGITLPLTETGKIVSDSDSLEPYREYEFFDALCKFKYLEKTMSFFKGIESEHVHPRYNPILNTGRVSCSNPNIQQLPRAEGVRQLFIPSSRHVFIDVDYSQLELCTLAQTTLHLYGESKMAELINEGVDLHKYYASILLNKNVDEISKEERQYAKAANFGFPGGLGIETFTTFAKKSYGLKIDRNQAQRMKDAWFRAFPEMRAYMAQDTGEAWTITGRKRGQTSYCAEKNTPFQGLGADAAKLALYELDKAGFRIVAFIHDQVLIEQKKTKNINLDMDSVCDIMIKAAKQVLPDIDIKVEGQITKEFTK